MINNESGVIYYKYGNHVSFFIITFSASFWIQCILSNAYIFQNLSIHISHKSILGAHVTCNSFEIKVWQPFKCDYQTEERIDRQQDYDILLSCYICKLPGNMQYTCTNTDQANSRNSRVINNWPWSESKGQYAASLQALFIRITPWMMYKTCLTDEWSLIHASPVFTFCTGTKLHMLRNIYLPTPTALQDTIPHVIVFTPHTRVFTRLRQSFTEYTEYRLGVIPNLFWDCKITQNFKVIQKLLEENNSYVLSVVSTISYIRTFLHLFSVLLSLQPP